MKKFLIILILTFLSYSDCFSQKNFYEDEQKFTVIGNFVTEKSDTIYNCRIGYRSFGNINDDSSNVILYCTWFGGNSDAIGKLIRKYQFIDTTKYFIIAVDALGNGISSSPSNYKGTFPEISIIDMINSQFLLLTQHLKIKKLYAVIGGSMGSMQALQWAVNYPDYMKKVIAYVPSPKITTYDLLWINTQINLIETLRKYNSSERDIKTLSDMITALIARTPDFIVKNISLDGFNDYLNSFIKDPDTVFTLDNYLLQIKAIRSFDISKNFDGSIASVSDHFRAKLFLIISENDMMVNPSSAFELADLTGCRRMVLRNNCGHLAVSCEIEKVRKEIADFLQD